MSSSSAFVHHGFSLTRFDDGSLSEFIKRGVFFFIDEVDVGEVSLGWFWGRGLFGDRGGNKLVVSLFGTLNEVLDDIE